MVFCGAGLTLPGRRVAHYDGLGKTNLSIKSCGSGLLESAPPAEETIHE